MSKNNEPTPFYFKTDLRKIPENSGITKYKVVLEFLIVKYG